MAYSSMPIRGPTPPTRARSSQYSSHCGVRPASIMTFSSAVASMYWCIQSRRRRRCSRIVSRQPQGPYQVGSRGLQTLVIRRPDGIGNDEEVLGEGQLTKGLV